MDVTELYHHCEGKSCNFCEWHAQNPIDLGWERLFEDNPWDNLSDTIMLQLIQSWMKSRCLLSMSKYL